VHADLVVGDDHAGAADLGQDAPQLVRVDDRLRRVAHERAFQDFVLKVAIGVREQHEPGSADLQRPAVAHPA